MSCCCCCCCCCCCPVGSGAAALPPASSAVDGPPVGEAPASAPEAGLPSRARVRDRVDAVDAVGAGESDAEATGDDAGSGKGVGGRAGTPRSARGTGNGSGDGVGSGEGSAGAAGDGSRCVSGPGPLSPGPVLRVCDSAAARAGLPGGEGGGATTDALLLMGRGGLFGDGSGGDGKLPRAGIGGGGGVVSAEGGSARGGGGGGGGDVSKGPWVGVTGGGWQPPRAQATARAVRLTMPPSSVVFCTPLPAAASGSAFSSELLGALLPASPLGAVTATAAQPSSLAASASSLGVLLVLSSASSSALCSALRSACCSVRGSVSAAATVWAWWEASSTEGRSALSKVESVDAVDPVELKSALGSRSVAADSLDRAGADSRAPGASPRAAWPGVSAGSAACSGGGTASSAR